MKTLNNFKSLFSHPRKPYLYAVTKGKYLGELLVFIEIKNSNYAFLALPEMKIREIPTDKFDFGIKNKIVDVVEKLPSYVHRTCVKQYNKNKTSLLALKDDKD